MARKLRTGTKPADRSARTESVFWRPDPDSSQKIKVLVDADEIQSAEQFSVWDFKPAAIWVEVENDPGRELGLKSRYLAFVPVAIKDDDGSKQVKYWLCPRTLHSQLHDFNEELGGTKGMILRLKREGKGIETRYSLIPMGSKEKVTEELPDEDTFLEQLGPEDAEGVKKLLIERMGVRDWDAVVEWFDGGASSDEEEL